MKKIAWLLLAALGLSVSAHGGTVYRLSGDSPVAEDTALEIFSENPRIIVFHPRQARLSLRGIAQTERLGGGCWRETYAARSGAVSVRLEKSLTEGVRSIEVMRDDWVLRFVPDAGEGLRVTTVPPLFIEEVRFANENRRGRLLDDYDSEIEGDRVRFLTSKIRYRSLISDLPVTLDVRILDPQGHLMRDGESPAGCSRQIAFRTGSVDADSLEQSLDRLRGPFRRGSRLELWCDGVQLFSARIPVRGRQICRPIISAVRDPWHARPTWQHKRWSRYHGLSREQMQVVWRELYLRNYTGPISNGFYITGWKVYEE